MDLHNGMPMTKPDIDTWLVETVDRKVGAAQDRGSHLPSVLHAPAQIELVVLFCWGASAFIGRDVPGICLFSLFLLTSARGLHARMRGYAADARHGWTQPLLASYAARATERRTAERDMRRCTTLFAAGCMAMDAGSIASGNTLSPSAALITLTLVAEAIRRYAETATPVIPGPRMGSMRVNPA